VSATREESELTISASILCPESDFEKGIFIPICVQAAYQQVLEPICEQNGLFLLADFGRGVDVGFSNFPQFINEVAEFLILLRDASSVDERQKKHLHERLEVLVQVMKDVFSKKQNVQFSIG